MGIVDQKRERADRYARRQERLRLGTATQQDEVVEETRVTHQELALKETLQELVLKET